MNLFPDLSLLAILVIFLITYWVVRRFFIGPVSEIVEAREHEIKSADTLYEQAMNRLSEATSEMEARLHAARRDASQLRDRFRTEAATHRATVIERTQEEAKSLIGEADSKLRGDVTAAREKITRDAEALARMAAEQILGRAV